jgi:hypothetical protein
MTWKGLVFEVLEKQLRGDMFEGEGDQLGSVGLRTRLSVMFFCPRTDCGRPQMYDDSRVILICNTSDRCR